MVRRRVTVPTLQAATDGGAGTNTLAHAYYPPPNGDGLAGDGHFDNGNTWDVSPSGGAIDLLEVAVHELGHSLGLGHEPAPPSGQNAIMNPIYAARFSG